MLNDVHKLFLIKLKKVKYFDFFYSIKKQTPSYFILKIRCYYSFNKIVISTFKKI